MAANLIDKNDPCPNENVTVACFNLHFCVKYLPEPGQNVDASRGFSELFYQIQKAESIG